MPEEPEVDIDRVHETIHERAEQEGSVLLRRIALTTALFAAMAAVASLEAGATVNEALVLKMEATRDQTAASDQWAYYQAKGVKSEVQDAARTTWLAAGKTPPPELEQAVRRYAKEQEEIQTRARELERARDEKSAEADHRLHRHHGFANAVADRKSTRLNSSHT